MAESLLTHSGDVDVVHGAMMNEGNILLTLHLRLRTTTALLRPFVGHSCTCQVYR